LEDLRSAYPLPRRCEFDEHALGSDVSLLVGVDNLARPRDRCFDVERQVGVHLGGHEAWHESQELDADGDCEPVGRRGGDACRVTAAFSSPRQRLVDDIPIVRSVDRLQDDRGIRRAVYRLETRHRAKIARVGYHCRHRA
jgi:hypothetical protein